MINQRKTLIPYLRSYWIDFVIVLIALLSVSLSLLYLGHAIKDFVDQGLSAKHPKNIDQSISIICILVFIFSISSFCRSYFINNVTEKIINNIRLNVYHKLLQIDIAHFETLKTGDIISRISTDIDAIGKLIISFLSFFIRNFIMFSGGIIMMFVYSPKLSIIVLLSLPILIIPLLKIGKRSRILSKALSEIQGELYSSIEESFNQIRIIHAYNQQKNRFNQFEKQTKEYLLKSSFRLKFRSLFFALAISLILLAIIFVIWIGTKDIISGSMSSGQMLSFIYYAILAGMSAGGIAEFLSETSGPKAAYDRVVELLALSYAQNQNSGNASSQQVNIHNDKVKFKTTIKFSNITFCYPSTPNIKTLDNVNFVLEFGKLNAIIGKSGSGKSTIFQLLMKFYYPTTGEIKIDDLNIENLSATVLRDSIAYVPQESSIFSGTILENITFSNPSTSNEEIIHLAGITGVLDFANKLPLGLNSKIGEKGSRISGGQKQRIALCRALIYKPKLLLLDEATSALDSESEHEILTNIQDFMLNTTDNSSAEKAIVVIAHRISSIEKADKIIVINKGVVLCSGTHEELLQRSALYCALRQEE